MPCCRVLRALRLQVQLGDKLGEGAFGTTYKAAWRGAKVRAAQQPQLARNWRNRRQRSQHVLQPACPLACPCTLSLCLSLPVTAIT